MTRLAPLSPTHCPELAEHFAFFQRTLGFVPNSLLTMQRRPKLVEALVNMSSAVYDPKGEVDLGRGLLAEAIDTHPQHFDAAVRSLRALDTEVRN